MQLRSDVAVAVVQASRCSSDSTPSLGTSICCRCGPKKEKKRAKKESEEGSKDKTQKEVGPRGLESSEP